MFLNRVISALEKAKVRYAIIGGYAVALHGAVRGTIDIDLVISLDEKSFVNAEGALKTIGLQPRLPVNAKEVFQFRKEYIKNRNLKAWSFVNHQIPSEVVDILITCGFEDIKTVIKKINSQPVHIIAIDDLIKMKKQSGRPQDLEDVKALGKLK